MIRLINVAKGYLIKSRISCLIWNCDINSTFGRYSARYYQTEITDAIPQKPRVQYSGSIKAILGFYR